MAVQLRSYTKNHGAVYFEYQSYKLHLKGYLKKCNVYQMPTSPGQQFLRERPRRVGGKVSTEPTRGVSCPVGCYVQGGSRSSKQIDLLKI